jgi:hypothetical protein
MQKKDTALGRVLVGSGGFMTTDAFGVQQA